MLLENRVAIITGGSRGIGKGIAQKFTEEGCSVVIVGRTEVGRKTLAEIVSQGGAGIFVQCDISNSRQVQKMVDQVIRQYGKVDILVNNAAIGPTPKFFTAISEEEYDQVLAINLKGTFLCCKAVVPHMQEKKYGKIINISSLAAIAPLATEAHYSAAKAGQLGLTIDLAFELAPFNICVNAILPGITDTDALNGVIPPGVNKYEFLSEQVKGVVPFQRLGTPQDIAGVALFLASDLSNFVTGDRIIVAGGSPLMPVKFD
jgi:NAD(P)-dependent dehydrogenase (short-subunit alcohol dehydrogenase family)